jgi:SAM-dependent methyltransferase
MKTLPALPSTLPFYFEATEDNNNAGFPKTFAFDIFYDDELKMYRQNNSQALKDVLDKAYLTGSMLSGGMNDVVVGGKRVDDAYNFIYKHYGITKDTKVLEIGCGEGQVLQRLAKDGVSCVGLEPGPQVMQIAGENLSIIKDFFPSPQVKDKFDLILHFGVLEHISDPVNFLLQQQQHLKEDGVIICAFPNCEPDLEAGDISMFLHEHYNYFSKEGIINAAPKANLSVEAIEEGPGGGFLFVKMVPSTTVNKSTVQYKTYTDEEFRTKMGIFNQAIADYFKDTDQADVAIYCPLRAMNVFYTAGITDCRLIDDNINLQGKYLPAFSKKVESFEELKANPPKKIFIYSKTFDKVIKEKCLKEEAFASTEISSLRDIL